MIGAGLLPPRRSRARPAEHVERAAKGSKAQTQLAAHWMGSAPHLTAGRGAGVFSFQEEDTYFTRYCVFTQDIGGSIKNLRDMQRSRKT